MVQFNLGNLGWHPAAAHAVASTQHGVPLAWVTLAQQHGTDCLPKCMWLGMHTCAPDVPLSCYGCPGCPSSCICRVRQGDISIVRQFFRNHAYAPVERLLNCNLASSNDAFTDTAFEVLQLMSMCTAKLLELRQLPDDEPVSGQDFDAELSSQLLQLMHIFNRAKTLYDSLQHHEVPEERLNKYPELLLAQQQQQQQWVMPQNAEPSSQQDDDMADDDEDPGGGLTYLWWAQIVNTFGTVGGFDHIVTVGVRQHLQVL